MIQIFRRHLAGCKFKSRKNRSCRCPIWAEGTVHGEKVRRSLDLSNWEAAVRLVREWEVSKPEKTVSMSDACDRFLADAKARKLREGSILKYEQAVKTLRTIDKTVRQVTVEDIRKLRESWGISALTMQKRLETVRSFFRFCEDTGWCNGNPAKAVKAPKTDPEPTLPFSDKEIFGILDALETKYLESHPFSNELTKKKIRAFILVMLHSGIRISDCVLLRKERINDGKLFIRKAHKNSAPVWVPLPPKVLDALDAIGATDFYFSTGRGKVKTWTTEWEERLKKVFVLAGLPEGHSHQLRDTFSVNLLRKGRTLEDVAALLGNTVDVCEKHYSPWVQSRQSALEDAVRATW